ncbi:PTS sugar transporter subunit IIA [Spiroplasma endosymbiont of Anurida maritima]|uniref:PTS sugar transporter subunit IIA n=1 Tax=Spiroplasma endosymbiont of Anurida maritima TaxID=2967972 RepID=UPI0036D25516
MNKDILNIEHVFVKQDFSSQKEVFQFLAKKYFELGFCSNEKKAYKGLIKREKEGTTGFNDGIAIPHARIKEISKPGVFVITFNEGIEWKSIDDSKVKVAIALAIPDSGGENQHIKILSSIARKLVVDDFRKQLLESNTKEDLFNVINQVEVK